MSPSPYRSGFATGIGVVLLAALPLAVIDVVHTGGGALAVLGFWSLVALPLALAVGAVLAGGNASWGEGWVRAMLRRLRDDADLDRRISAILLAAAPVGFVLVKVVGFLSIALVGNVQRKNVGAMLLGVAVVLAIPVLSLAVIPLYRITRHVTRFIPSIGPFSRVVLLAIGAALAGVAAMLFVIFRKLDYQNLPLGPLYMAAAFPVLILAIALVMYGPATKLRERVPKRDVLAAIGALLAIAFPIVGLRAPSEDARDRVTDRSYVGAPLVRIMRAFIDRDGDQWSAFFGGPDCNDRDKGINPKAKEIPDDGIDQNCDGFDGHVDATSSNPTPQDTPKSTISGGQNVLVIFVDTLRFDRLGIAGYQRDGKSLTPRIDAFAKQGVVFKRAFAQAPNTPRSVPSFLTSRYPSQLQLDDNFKDYPTVLDDNDFLFEALRPAGFKTFGVSSHFYFCDRKRYPDVCDGVVKWMEPNALQGADEWDNSGALNIPESNKDVAGPRIVKKAIAKLDELAASKQKFAMLVHLFEPHSTYVTHEGYPITERGTASLAQKYDYEIAVEDKLIGELLDQLEKSGLAQNTTVVLMADHGEAFGVHTLWGEQMFFHGQTLYRELLHVPLIFRVPGGKACVRDEVVQLIDLAPTIAALFDVKPPSTWQGRSLTSALECGPAMAARPAFAELMPARAWNHEAKSMISANGNRHVFHRISDKRWEIYDLEADPDEKTSIADTDPEAKQLEQQLAQWADSLR